jgi:hypothetical protein
MCTFALSSAFSVVDECVRATVGVFAAAAEKDFTHVVPL